MVQCKISRCLKFIIGRGKKTFVRELPEYLFEMNNRRPVNH